MEPILKLPGDFADYGWEVEAKGHFWWGRVVHGVDGKFMVSPFRGSGLVMRRR